MIGVLANLTCLKGRDNQYSANLTCLKGRDNQYSAATWQEMFLLNSIPKLQFFQKSRLD